MKRDRLTGLAPLQCFKQTRANRANFLEMLSELGKFSVREKSLVSSRLIMLKFIEVNDLISL